MTRTGKTNPGEQGMDALLAHGKTREELRSAARRVVVRELADQPREEVTLVLELLDLDPLPAEEVAA